MCSANSYCDNSERFICTANSYCDNNGGVLYVVFTVMVIIMSITERCIGSVNSYCDNNVEVYM
jgi:hypothetical protein